MAGDIHIDVKYDGDDNEIAIISARGFIDTTTAPELEKKLEEQLALNKYKIIVNLENIDYVSSAGWGVFVSEIREIRENNGDLVLVNMSPDVYDVYELMEFSSILKSYNSVEEAIAGFTGREVKPQGLKAETKPPRLEKPAAQRPQMVFASSAPAASGAQAAPSSTSSKTSPAVDVFSIARSELGKKIIQVIIDNPYFEPKEIARALRLPQYGGQKVGGGAVKKELKAMGLYDKQRRFELALKGRA
jgi:anti-anti-sigma factor